MPIHIRKLPRLTESDELRLWDKIDVRGKTSCWPWKELLSHTGYGLLRVNHRNIFSHRLVYHLLHPEENIDKSLVLHKCDNRRCNNPSHLFVGTAFDNSLDMCLKKRSRHGDRNYNSKLSNAQVKRLREAYVFKKESQFSLAKKLGLSFGSLAKILAGETYQHAGGPTRKRGNHRGSTNGASKLNEKQVLRIKRLLAQGKLTKKSIAELYGVTASLIYYIEVGKAWAHLPLDKRTP